MEVYIKILTFFLKLHCLWKLRNLVHILHRFAMREFVLNKDFLTADIILCMYVNLLHSWSRSLEAI